MIRPITLVLGSLASTLALACSSSDEPPPTSPAALDPTFTNVTKQVVNDINCGGPLCHGFNAGGFTLGTKDELHAALVDQPASGKDCKLAADAGAGATAFILVVPGKPDDSLLYQKLMGRQSCGKKMPDNAKVFTTEQLDLVHDWIADGAKND
jgi:hypothetical protein